MQPAVLKVFREVCDELIQKSFEKM